MSDAILRVSDISKSFDGVRALAGISFETREREILGLIGPNGAGKTTLFNVISGFIAPEVGQVILKSSDVTHLTASKRAGQGIARTFQNLRLIRQLSVMDNLLLSFRGQPGEFLTNVFFRWRKSLENEAIKRREANQLLEKTGLAGKCAELAGNLSYGQQKLLSIICCLAAKADLLLLDEPVAGIDPEMRCKILHVISDLPTMGKSVILIEHDLDAVMQICDHVIFMDAGAKVSEGRPDEVRNDPRVIAAYID